MAADRLPDASLHQRRHLADAGRPRPGVSDRHAARLLDSVVGGWQYTAPARFYSGRPLLFDHDFVVNGDPTLDDPTRDRWFDTSMFALQDSFTPRSNPSFFDGLTARACS